MAGVEFECLRWRIDVGWCNGAKDFGGEREALKKKKEERYVCADLNGRSGRDRFVSVAGSMGIKG